MQTIPVANRAFLGQPAGQVLDISDTSELMPGDIVYVQFPLFSRGSLKFGGSESFRVVSVSDAGVQVVDESGGPFTLPAGSRDALEAQLLSMTSVSRILIIRPSAAAEEIPVSQRRYMAPPPFSDAERDATFARNYDFLIPGYNYEPLNTRDPADLEVADLILDDCGDLVRIWGVERVDPDGTLGTVLIKSSDPHEITGLGSSRPDMAFFGCELAIRVEKPPIEFGYLGPALVVGAVVLFIAIV